MKFFDWDTYTDGNSIDATSTLQSLFGVTSERDSELSTVMHKAVSEGQKREVNGRMRNDLTAILKATEEGCQTKEELVVCLMNLGAYLGRYTNAMINV